MPKKILFLGAAAFQIPPIEYALERGYTVITCDNRPSNPGHCLAHKYFNVSTVDKLRVAEVARSEKIDGILSFGSDVGASTAAYVAEMLNLPTVPYAVVELLAHKRLFREFLNRSNLQCQEYFCVSSESKTPRAHDLERVGFPLVVKPVDAAGSKGVSILHDRTGLTAAIDYALSKSRSGEVIIEAFVRKIGRQVCGDGFMDGGELAFVQYGDGFFHGDQNYLAPFGESFPATHPEALLKKLSEKIESTLKKCGFLRGVFNIDAILTPGGAPFIIELGPRSGGNFIPTAIRLRTNVDLIAASVEVALDPTFKLRIPEELGSRYIASYMIHSLKNGVLNEVKFDKGILPHIESYTPYLKTGSEVSPFRAGGEAIGNVLLQFDSREEMAGMMENIGEYFEVPLEESAP